MTVHRGVLRRGRDNLNFLHRMTNLGGHAEQPGEMRFGSELEHGFARWLPAGRQSFVSRASYQ